MLHGFDAESAEELRRSFVKRGVTVMLGHGYKSMERKGGRWTVTLDAAGTAKTVEAEAVLVAVGRNPLSPNLGLEKGAVELDRGIIKVGGSFRTAAPSSYATGGVIR